MQAKSGKKLKMRNEGFTVSTSLYRQGPSGQPIQGRKTDIKIPCNSMDPVWCKILTGVTQEVGQEFKVTLIQNK